MAYNKARILYWMRHAGLNPEDLFLIGDEEIQLFVPDIGNSAFPRERRYAGGRVAQGEIRRLGQHPTLITRRLVQGREIRWEDTFKFRREIARPGGVVTRLGERDGTQNLSTDVAQRGGGGDVGSGPTLGQVGVRRDIDSPRGLRYRAGASHFSTSDSRGSVGGATDDALREAKKRIVKNLCVNTGKGSGGGFTNCGGSDVAGGTAVFTVPRPLATKQRPPATEPTAATFSQIDMLFRSQFTAVRNVKNGQIGSVVEIDRRNEKIRVIWARPSNFERLRGSSATWESAKKLAPVPWKDFRKAVESPGADAARRGKFERPTPEAFAAALKKNTRADTLSQFSADELKGMKLFKLKGYDAGYAIKPGGELVNLFNSDKRAKGSGVWMVLHAIENGARHGDHFDGHLTGFYKQLGFTEARREANWTPGGPDVIYIKWNAGPVKTARARLSRLGYLEPTGMGESTTRRSGAGTGGFQPVHTRIPQTKSRDAPGSDQSRVRTTMMLEGQRKIAGNLCVPKGKGSGSGFRKCGAGDSGKVADSKSKPTKKSEKSDKKPGRIAATKAAIIAKIKGLPKSARKFLDDFKSLPRRDKILVAALAIGLNAIPLPGPGALVPVVLKWRVSAARALAEWLGLDMTPGQLFEFSQLLGGPLTEVTEADMATIAGMMSTDRLSEAKKKLIKNLCVNTGSGSGGGFTSCGGSNTKGANSTRSVVADPKTAVVYSSGDKLLGKYKLKVLGSDKEAVASAATKLVRGIEKAGDICKARPPVCAGNLGLDRGQMPQLDKPTTKNFLDSYRKEGVKVSNEWMSVGKLKATQGEINAQKVAGMMRNVVKGEFKGITAPIIISKDNYILDGHHRWAAMISMHPGNKMQVVKVDVPMKQLLKRAQNFKGVEKRSFAESVLAVLNARMARQLA